MRERPILFSAPMIRAILAGTKTQTRRLVKPAKTGRLPAEADFVFTGLDEHGFGGLTKQYGDLGRSIFPLPRSPFGVVGDRLWVKETWARRLDEDDIKPTDLKGDWAWYWADPQTANTGCAGAAGKRRPSIFMQRRFSRITLEITDVRVQRLTQITADDARAEGFSSDPIPGSVNGKPATVCFFDPLQWFAALWDGINGKRAPWKAAPWVWAISFRRIP